MATINGTTGNDSISGGAGNDSLFGDAGLDTIFGGDGNDTLFGGDGYDSMWGGNGNDVFDGGAGDDWIVGQDPYIGVSPPHDGNTLFGGDGNDRLTGANGNDSIVGGDGNDFLGGTGGADTVLGGAGDDSITFEELDQIDGGTGNNTALFRGAGDLSFDMSIGNFSKFNYSGDRFRQMNDMDIFSSGVNPINVSISSSLRSDFGNHRVTGTDGDDFVSISANALNPVGSSFIDGKGGNDNLSGSRTNDTVYGGDGGDSISLGRNGVDFAYGEAGDDTISVSARDDGAAAVFVDGGDGRDSITIVGAGNIFGGAGDDNIRITAANELTFINGGAGDDSISVSGAVDLTHVYGGDGYDILDARSISSAISGFDFHIQSIEYVFASDQDDYFKNSGSNSVIYSDNGGSNTYEGGSGVDDLRISGGSQSINAGAGDDIIRTFTEIGSSSTITGGAGNDRFFGGEGIEYFDFDLAFSNFSITASRLPNRNFEPELILSAFGDVDTINANLDDFIVFSDQTVSIASFFVPSAMDDSATVNKGDAVTFSPLANDTDPDGDTLSILSVGATPNGTILINGDGTITYTPNAGFFGIDAFDYTITDNDDGTATGQITVTVNDTNSPPIVSASPADQTAPEDSVFSFSVPAGTFTDVDTGDTLTLSASLVNGDPLPSWLSFDTASGTFSGTPLNDNVGAIDLRVTATDSESASVSTDFTLTVQNVNDAPVVTPATVDVPINTTVGLSSLFTATDVDAGDAIETFQIRDNTNAGGSLRLNGVTFDPFRTYTLTAAELSSVEFVADSATGVQDRIRIRANDGEVWGAWRDLRINNAAPAGNTAPVITPLTTSVEAGSSLAASAIFGISDADSDTVSQIQIRDLTAGRGNWRLNGVDLGTNVVHSLTPADLGGLEFVGADARTNDTVRVRAFDGFQWSGWQQIRINTLTPTTNSAPTVAVGNTTVAAGAALAIGDLATVSDADGDTITRYQIRDDVTGGGYFTVGGAPAPERSTRTLTAAQFASVEYIGGATAGTQNVRIRGYDGFEWGAWQTIAVTTTVAPGNQAPIVTAGLTNVVANGSLSASDLFSAADGDGDAVTQYELRDTNAGGSTLQLGGVAVADGTSAIVAAGDLGTVDVLGGNGFFQDTIQVRAFDGTDWGLWRDITVTTTEPAGNFAPVVAATGGDVAINGTVAGTSLFSVADVEGHPVTRYQIRDETNGVGNWRLGGSDLAEFTTHTVSEADIGDLEFVGGSTVANNRLRIRADDGFGWGGWRTINVATTPPVGNSAAVVTLTQNTVEGFTEAPITALLSITDPDGDSVERIQISDRQLDRGSLHLAGLELDPIITHTIEAADLGDLTFAGGSTRTNNTLRVRAFDGYQWSAWQNYRIDTVTPTGNVRPVVTQNPVNTTVSVGQPIAASSLFTATDSDGHAISRFQVRDNTNGGGYLSRNGTRINDRGTVTLNTAQLGELSFVGGDAAATDSVRVRAYDGFEWGAWSTFDVTTDPITVVSSTGSASETLTGASGPNVFSYSIEGGADTVSNTGTAGERDFLRISDNAVSALAGHLDSVTDDLRFTRLGDDLRVDVLLDGTDAAGSVLIQGMALTDSMVETLQLFDTAGVQIGNDIDLTSVFAAAGTSSSVQEDGNQTLFGRTITVV